MKEITPKENSLFGKKSGRDVCWVKERSEEKNGDIKRVGRYPKNSKCGKKRRMGVRVS